MHCKSSDTRSRGVTSTLFVRGCAATRFKISYDKICENYNNLGLSIKVLPIIRLYQKITPQICLILHQLNLYVFFW